MTSQGAIDSEGLTVALRHCGVLGDGRVRDVVVENARSTVLSQIIRLRVSYEGDAMAAPASLIVKTGLAERLAAGWNGGRQEVTFYRQIAAMTPAGMVPRCFEGKWDAATHEWRLILEDLTETHFTGTTWPLPPGQETCAEIFRTWARFHAHWWDDPRLGVSIGAWGDAGAIEAYLRRLTGKFAEFADRLGDCLPRERKDLYEALFDRAPRLLARTDNRRDVTIVHGDAHWWNCFLPRDGGADVRLFDWDTWRLGVATDDLAYMMAVHWYPDRRRRLERPLLDVYHAALQSHGASDYSRSRLDDDYRLSVLWQITTPIWQAGANIPPVIWWNNLERVLLAADDLACRDLLA